jgi:uncharacterized protein (TIGR02594 family)
MNTREIQLALQAKGFDPGPIDGVRGRMTIAAVKAFQAANNLVVDGIVGPRTSAALFGQRPPTKSTTPVPITLPWYAEAWRLIGVDEDVGAGSNRMILKWAEDLDIPYGDDEIPWCGLFVAHCIGSQLTDEALPTNPLGARNWGRFGDHVSPQPGAVMVFWRESMNSYKGHVAFYSGEDDSHYHVLGGNQSNTVSVTRVSKQRFIDSRWPKSAGPATGRRHLVASDGTPISDTEQ